MKRLAALAVFGPFSAALGPFAGALGRFSAALGPFSAALGPFSGVLGPFMGVLAALSIGCSGGEAPSRGPRISSYEPSGRVEGTVPIRMRFTADAAEALVGRPRPLDAVLLSHPPLEGTATFVEPRVLHVEPSAPFAPATRYRLAVRADVLGGAPLSGSRALSFFTPSFGLEDGRGWRTEEGARLALRFSHPVDPRAVEAAAVVRAKGGALLGHRADHPDRAPGGWTAVPAPAQRVHLAIDAAPPEVWLELDAGLSTPEGGAPLGKLVSREVPIDAEAPVIDRVRPVQFGAQWAVAVDLGAPVPPSRLVGAVRGAGPRVQLALSPDGPWVLGAFTPETTASVQIGPPLLDPPRPWVVELPALQPALRLLDPEPMLDLPPGARLEVEHHGVETLVLTARLVPPERLILIDEPLSAPRPVAAAGLGEGAGPLRVGAHPSGRTSFNPAPVLDGLRPGLVRLEIHDERRPWLRDVRYLNRRGLDLTVKRRPGYAWVRVSDLEGAVAGAGVRVFGAAGEVLAAGTSDGAGAVSLKLDGPGVLVAAQDGRRSAVLPLDGPVALRGSGQPGLVATLLADRTTLGPGQSAELSVLLADARGRPTAALLTARLRRPRGPAVAEISVRVEPRGTGQASLEVPGDAEPGRYRLELLDPSGHGLAEVALDVRRPGDKSRRVEVRAEPPLGFVIEAHPGVGRLAGRCRYRRIDRFGGLPPPPGPAPRFEPVAVDLGDGEARRVRCPEPPGGARPWEVRFEVSAPGGEEEVATLVHAPEPRYAAILLPEAPPREGEPLGAAVQVVDSRGRPVEGSVELEIRPLEPRPGARIRRGRLVPDLLSVPGEAQILTLALVDGAATVPFVPARGGPWSLWLGELASTLWVSGAPGTPRPLALEMYRTRAGVQVAFPFPGRLLLTEEDLEVVSARASLETGVSATVPVGKGNHAVTGLLVGADGQWSAARLPPPTPDGDLAAVELTAPDRLAPGAPIDVTVRVRGPAWSGVARLFAVEARSAPTEAQLLKWAQPPTGAAALDTLVTAALDDPEPAPEVEDRWEPRSAERRPGRVAVASPWLGLSSDGFARARLPWPEVSGRARLFAVVRAGGRIGVASVERLVGDGLSAEVLLPPAVRPGDTAAAEVRLANDNPTSMTVRVAVEGEGFKERALVPPVTVPAGGTATARVGAQAGPDGGFELRVGEVRVVRPIRRIAERRRAFLGRGATATGKNPVVLPTPESIGARRARLVIGPSAVTRYAAALAALFEPGPLDPERAAAAVLAGQAEPKIARALGAEAVLAAAAAEVERGYGDPDPWLRAFSAHAGLGLGAGAARQVLAEVAAGNDPAAAAYARFLLARSGRTVASLPASSSSRPDVLALAAVADRLLDRAEPGVLEALPLAPYAGERVGRASRTLVDALALWALEALPEEHPVAAAFEAAIIEAARMSRWTHPAEEALAVLALGARARRTARRPYWGTALVDGEVATKFSSLAPVVVDLSDRLAGRPEVTVTGAGAAEVGLVLEGGLVVRTSPGLRLGVRRRAPSGEPREGRLTEGERFVLEVEVTSSAPAAEGILLDVPLPAGLAVEVSPPGARARPGGYHLTATLHPGASLVARFEVEARFAGVWHAPPIRAALRHAGTEVELAQEPLVIEPP